MSDKKLERFGRYLLLDHLADGGMAKICRARFLGEQADKVVAIKMVQPQFSKDDSFKQMFMDEIKVAFGLSHPNIAQTYDYGEHKGQLYTAMELVDGANIKEFIDKLAEKKYVFPVPIAVYLIAQASIGLHYAHTVTNKLTGKPLKIVHRDISPHNIMLTYDGAVKVIDFGIAKAESNTDATQAGTIKGKLSYLAPEYLDGKTLDARYDEFALGITLWEMLCSRKLFKAKNELAVLKQIQACKVPLPSSINPHVPKELDQIVMKALDKDREKRYDDCDQFNRALVKFLYSYDPDFNPMDMKKFAHGVFKAEIKKDKEKFFEFGKIDIKPYLDELKQESEGKTQFIEVPVAMTSTSGGGHEQKKRESRELDFGFVKEEKAMFSKTTKTEGEEYLQMEKSRKPKAKAALQSSRTGVKSLKKKSDQTRFVTPGGTTTEASSKADSNDDYGKKKSSSIGPLILLIGVAVFGYTQFSTEIMSRYHMIMGTTTTVDSAIEQKKTNEKSVTLPEPTVAAGTISLSGYDRTKHKVYINSVLVKPNIVGEIETAFSNEIVLRIEERGRQHFVKKLSLSENMDSINITVSDMPTASYGYLVTSHSCVTGHIIFSLYGEDRKETLPISIRPGIAFPMGSDLKGRIIPKTYDVYYEALGDKSIQRKASFTVSSVDEIVDFCEGLTQYH